MELEDADQVIERVALRISELRAATGETQAEVAEAIGTTLSNYQRIEHGLQNLTIRTLVRIAVAIGVRTIDLFTPPTTARRARGRPKKAAAYRTSRATTMKVAEPAKRGRAPR